MLIQFSVENYRSFDKKVTFSMVAGKGNELEDHVFNRSNMSLVKTAAIYGANASGKSNLFKALLFMKQFVVGSMKTMQSVDEIPVMPFLLNDESHKNPSSFEVVIFIANKLFRYGFSTGKKEVLEEWLFEKECKPKSQEICLFKRYKQTINTRHPKFKEGNKKLDSFLRENILYISMLDKFNGTISRSILEWFSDINTTQSGTDLSHTIVLLQNNLVHQEWIDKFIQKADVGIKGISLTKEPLSEDVINGLRKIYDVLIDDDKKSPFTNDRDLVKTNHTFFSSSDNTYKTVDFDMVKQESEGTNRLFSLAGHLYESLTKGKVMLIDEIEASLHPMLVDIIIGLFQSQESNPNGAQLIFTTHNTGLLTNDRFRRDEIWFTEKDEFGATDLYSLSDYSPRKDASYNKDYLRGKYGALPFVNLEDFISSFKKYQESE